MTTGNNGMTKIFKYPLEVSKDQGISLPKGAKILKFAVQNSQVFLWAQVIEGSGSEELRHFRVYGTGQEIKDIHTQKHLDTVFIGPYVWHIYEKFGENKK